MSPTGVCSDSASDLVFYHVPTETGVSQFHLQFGLTLRHILLTDLVYFIIYQTCDFASRAYFCSSGFHRSQQTTDTPRYLTSVLPQIGGEKKKNDIFTMSAYEIFIEAKHLHNPITLSKQEQHDSRAAAAFVKNKQLIDEALHCMHIYINI